MIPFSEALRYEFDLKPDDIVWDVGGYEGNWGRIIAEKYGCKVHIFEPIDAFYCGIMNNLLHHPQRANITVHHFGVAGTTREDTFHVKGDSSGIVADGPAENVMLLGVVDLLNNSLFADKQIAVLKLNCEGSEYEILEALLDAGLDHRFTNIQVQPHNVVPRAEERWAFIKNRLMLNHRMTFDEPWCWTGFTLK